MSYRIILFNLLRIAPDMLFNTADTLAMNLGLDADDERRLEAGVNWILGNLDNQWSYVFTCR